MKRAKRLMAAVTAAVLATAICTGCSKPALEIGFNYELMLASVGQCAVRSDRTEFPAEDVTLDFYFSMGEIEDNHIYINYILQGFALYFVLAEHIFTIDYLEPVEDYKAIENYYFIKAIEIEEYDPEEYAMEMSFWKGKTFKHHESFTVPHELFEEKETGTFFFVIVNLQYSTEQNRICVERNGSVEIFFNKAENGTIVLSNK